jgi:hypothetical protein
LFSSRHNKSTGIEAMTVVGSVMSERKMMPEEVVDDGAQ